MSDAAIDDDEAERTVDADADAVEAIEEATDVATAVEADADAETTTEEAEVTSDAEIAVDDAERTVEAWAEEDILTVAEEEAVDAPAPPLMAGTTRPLHWGLAWKGTGLQPGSEVNGPSVFSSTTDGVVQEPANVRLRDARKGGQAGVALSLGRPVHFSIRLTFQVSEEVASALFDSSLKNIRGPSTDEVSMEAEPSLVTVREHCMQSVKTSLELRL
jgi:hypothetical protein